MGGSRATMFKAVSVTLLLIAVMFGRVDSQPPFEVVSIRSVNTTDSGLRQASLNIIRGISAAFAGVNAAGGINGRNLSLVVYDDEAVSAAGAEIAAKMTKYLNTSTVFMSVARTQLPAIDALSSIPHVSPYPTHGYYFEPSRRSMLHIKLPWPSEILATVIYGVNSPATRCKQFVIAHGTHAQRIAGVQELNESFARLGLPPPRTFTIPSRSATGFDTLLSNLSDLVYQYPRAQCVMVFHRTQVGPAIVRIKQDARYDGQVYFFTQSQNSDTIALGTDPAQLGGLYASQMFPNPQDPEYTVVQAYGAALNQLATSNFPAREKQQFGESVPVGGYPASYEGLEGYVAARFYIDILKNVIGEITHESILETIYRRGTVTVEDLVFGPYIDSCSGGRTADVYGTCWCNTGAKLLHTSIFNVSQKRFVNVIDSEARYARPAISLSSCALDSTTLQPYRFVLLPQLGSATPMEAAAQQHLRDAMQSLATAFFEKRTARYLFQPVVVTTSSSNFTNFTSIEERYLLDVIAFPTKSIAELTASSSRALVIAPMRSDLDLHHVELPEVIPGSRGESDHLVTMFPTRADVIHAAFAYFAGRSVRIAFDTSIQDEAARSALPLSSLISSSAETFGVNVVEYFAVSQDAGVALTGIASDLPIVAIVRDNRTIREALAISNHSEVVFASSEILIDAIIAEDRWVANPESQGSRARVVSALSQYNEPAQLERAALTSYGMAVQSLLSLDTLSLDLPIQPAQITEVLYRNEYFTTDFGRFGPFSRELRCNKGATRFFVHSLPMLYRLNDTVEGSNTTAFFHELEGCTIRYTAPSHSSHDVPTLIIIVLIVVIVALIMFSVAVVKLCRKGCTTVTMRRFVQSPFMSGVLRLVFQLLDIITDAISCYIVISRNVNVVFTALFTLLTISAGFANIYEIITTMFYLRFVLHRLTLEGTAKSAAQRPQATPMPTEFDNSNRHDVGERQHSVNSNPLGGGAAVGEDEEDRKGSTGPVIDFSGAGTKPVFVGEASMDSRKGNNSGTRSMIELNNPMIEKQLWEQRLAHAAIATLLLEDLPMCVLTTAALVEDSSELFLFVSLIISCILLGTKLNSLQRGLMKIIKKMWRKSDAARLSKLARELDENASAEDMRHLVDRHSDEGECVAFANLLEEHNPDRYDALTNFGEKLVLQMDELQIDTSEFFAVVMQTVRAHDAALSRSSARSGHTDSSKRTPPIPRSRETSRGTGMASSHVSLMTLKRRLGDLALSARSNTSQLRHLTSATSLGGSGTLSNRSSSFSPRSAKPAHLSLSGSDSGNNIGRPDLPPLPKGAASATTECTSLEQDPRRGTAPPSAASVSLSDSERLTLTGGNSLLSPAGPRESSPNVLEPDLLLSPIQEPTI